MRCRTESVGHRLLAAVTVLLFGLAAGSTALGGHDDEPAGSGEEQKADKVIVEPYETRPNPTHEVSLKDGRVYFLKKLQETEGGYILHTLENETIEITAGEVDNIKVLKKSEGAGSDEPAQ